MPRFPERNLNQKCVYWGNPVNDGYGGYTWEDPVELDCRWIESTRVVTDSNGKEVIASAVVQLTQDAEVDGALWLGELTDLDSDDDPFSVGAYRIIRFDKIPLMKAIRFYRVAFLGSTFRGVNL